MSKEKRVLTVLRSGGDFQPRHVQAMQRHIARWTPAATFACLSDVKVEGVECIPLKHDWPGWWAKLELFRPDLDGDFLFTDLDNVVLGPIDDLFTGEYTTQRFGWNALMYVPSSLNGHVYEQFCRHPDSSIAEWNEPRGNGVPFGDAGFIAQYLQSACWEDLLPGQVVNIVELKRPWPFCRLATFPDVRVVLCGGRDRRPWILPEFKHLYEENV